MIEYVRHFLPPNSVIRQIPASMKEEFSGFHATYVVDRDIPIPGLSLKTLGVTAQLVVSLQNNHVHAIVGQNCGRSEASDTGTDNNGIKHV